MQINPKHSNYSLDLPHTRINGRAQGELLVPMEASIREEDLGDNKKQGVIPLELGFLTRQAQRPAADVLAAPAG